MFQNNLWLDNQNNGTNNGIVAQIMAQICSLFNVSRQTATRDLSDIVNKKMISKKRKGRGAYYESK